MRASFLALTAARLARWVPAFALLAPALALADASTPARPPPPQSLTVGDRDVTIGFGEDWKIHVRVANGGELVLEPAGRAYVGHDAWRLDAVLLGGLAPVPLVRIVSHPEACGDNWQVYVSVVDGVPRQALALYGLAAPPAMRSSTVEFARDGTAVVTTRTTEDEEDTRITRARYRFDGHVYVAVPKGANVRSR